MGRSLEGTVQLTIKSDLPDFTTVTVTVTSVRVAIGFNLLIFTGAVHMNNVRI